MLFMMPQYIVVCLCFAKVRGTMYCSVHVGAVDKGRWQGRDIAVKMLSKKLLGDLDARERAAELLRLEALIMSQLYHPNIARVYGGRNRVLSSDLCAAASQRPKSNVDAADIECRCRSVQTLDGYALCIDATRHAVNM